MTRNYCKIPSHHKVSFSSLIVRVLTCAEMYLQLYWQPHCTVVCMVTSTVANLQRNLLLQMKILGGGLSGQEVAISIWPNSGLTHKRTE